MDMTPSSPFVALINEIIPYGRKDLYRVRETGFVGIYKPENTLREAIEFYK
jgi:hypothetical protein